MNNNQCHSLDDRNSIRVCSAQFSSTWEDPEKSLARAELFVRHAADCDAKIICFPEQFATGWDPESRKISRALMKVSLRHYGVMRRITRLPFWVRSGNDPPRSPKIPHWQ